MGVRCRCSERGGSSLDLGRRHVDLGRRRSSCRCLGRGRPQIERLWAHHILSFPSALPTPSTPPEQDGRAKGGGAIGVGTARGQPKARPLPQPAPTIAWAGAAVARATARATVPTRGGRGAAVVVGPREAGDSERSHAAPGADGEPAINRKARGATSMRRAAQLRSAVADGGSMLQVWAWVLWIVSRCLLAECVDKLIAQRSGVACPDGAAATGAVPHG